MLKNLICNKIQKRFVQIPTLLIYPNLRSTTNNEVNTTRQSTQLYFPIFHSSSHSGGWLGGCCFSKPFTEGNNNKGEGTPVNPTDSSRAFPDQNLPSGYTTFQCGLIGRSVIRIYSSATTIGGRFPDGKLSCIFCSIAFVLRLENHFRIDWQS